MEAYFNCAIGSLEAYVPNAGAPRNEARVKHLYRRLGFGANLEMIQNALLQNPVDVVDALIDDAIANQSFQNLHGVIGLYQIMIQMTSQLKR